MGDGVGYDKCDHTRHGLAFYYGSTVLEYCWAFSGVPALLDGVVVPKTLFP